MTHPDGNPMQVVSGPVGREPVHYEAPAADQLDAEMTVFLKWFETATPDPVLKAGVAHLWFALTTPSAMETAAWRAPSPTQPWPVPKARRSDSTACLPKSALTGRPNMKF